MSVEAIVEVIESEAADEAERIVTDARARACALVDAAEGSVAARVASATERAEPACRAEAMRAANASRLRVLELRAERTAALVDSAFVEAEARLVAIADAPQGAPAADRWRRALEALICEALEFTGEGARVTVRGRDVAVVRPMVVRIGACLDETVDGEPAPGAVVSSGDGRILVDATLPARLARARAALAEPVARRLGLLG